MATSTNKNCRIWSEANSQVYVETPLHPEKLTVWCALWASGILLRKRLRPQRYSQCALLVEWLRQQTKLRIWSEANPQVYAETPLHPEKLTVWCALWAGGIIGPYFFKNDEGHNVTPQW
ncbi:hypothetical protein TNCV_793491 [Trichonephila clavipes]|nr:hypothetical protein TNCV_793491 [Trichonephila clavipes]